MRKKLVFFLYIGDDRTPQERISAGFVAKVHFYCLKKYRKIFDKAKFVLSVKEELIGNTKLISEYVDFIMSLGYLEDTEFVVEKNTNICESKTFKEEIVETKDNDGWLLFFAHLRGERSECESVVRWVFSNYYFALEDAWQIDYWCSSVNRAFFGFPLTDCRQAKPLANELIPKEGYYYMGTILWANPSLIKEIIRQDNNGEYPLLFGRFYSENFPASAVNWGKIATFNNISCLTGYDLYTQFDLMFDNWCEYAGFDKKKFDDALDEIKNGDI